MLLPHRPTLGVAKQFFRRCTDWLKEVSWRVPCEVFNVFTIQEDLTSGDFQTTVRPFGSRMQDVIGFS